MFLIGIKQDAISFAYSYDATLSRLAGSTAGSHEISIVFEYPQTKKTQVFPRSLSEVLMLLLSNKRIPKIGSSKKTFNIEILYQ